MMSLPISKGSASLPTPSAPVTVIGILRAWQVCDDQPIDLTVLQRSALQDAQALRRVGS